MIRYTVLVIALLTFLCFGSDCAQAAPLDHGTGFGFHRYPNRPAANELLLHDLTGRPVTLGGLRGKVVILNFWKIECPPCFREKPILERIYRKYAARGLAVICVNLSDPHDRQLAYVRGNGFSYTFAFDPAGSLSLRRERLGRGGTTTLVVNASAEALYEIPGVPTSYVIDRDGRIVGNAVGMVNWEEPGLERLLESLLGTPSDRSIAGTPGPLPLIRNQVRPAVAIGPGPHDPAAANVPVHVVSQAAFMGAEPRLISGPPIQRLSQRDEPYEGSLTTHPPASPEVEPTQKKPAVRKKPERKQSAQSEEGLRHPKPYGPTASQGARATAKPPATSPQAIYPTAPMPGMPPTTQGAGLPPLPPALPYTPPRGQGPQPAARVVPDQDGTVRARVPGYVPGAVPQVQTRGELPSARPAGTRNPISGFVLESFEPRRPTIPAQPPETPTVGPTTQPVPSPPGQLTSAFGQISQDIRQLGAEIKGAFQRIMPGK